MRNYSKNPFVLRFIQIQTIDHTLQSKSTEHFNFLTSVFFPKMFRFDNYTKQSTTICFNANFITPLKRIRITFSPYITWVKENTVQHCTYVTFLLKTGPQYIKKWMLFSYIFLKHFGFLNLFFSPSHKTFRGCSVRL